MKLADFHSMFSVLFCTSAACSSMQYRVAKDEKQRGSVSVVCGLCLCSPHHLWLVPLLSPPPVACASAIPIIRGCASAMCSCVPWFSMTGQMWLPHLKRPCQKDFVYPSISLSPTSKCYNHSPLLRKAS